MSARRHRWLLAMVYLAALAVVVGFAVDGWSYYTTPLPERPRHADYWELKPGGATGHSLGVVGSGLMVLMLVYSIRKRSPRLRRAGQLRWWLNFHIFCGVVGPLLVILHTSFKVRGLVALSFWSMIVAATSGVFGRYLYLQVPRRRSGDELTLAETLALNEQLRLRLVTEFGLSTVDLTELDRVATVGLDERPGLLRALIGSLTDRWAFGRRLRRFRHSLPEPRGRLSRELSRALRRKAELERRIRLWSELQRLFYGWHLFHKPFAVIMYLFMILHIAVAIATGYGGL